jgi:integrase
MASIERVKKGNGERGWRARYRSPDGRSREKWFDRKVDAEQFLTSIEHSKNSGAFIDPNAGQVRFAVFAEEWAAAQDWKETSREAWPNVFKRLDPLLGAMPLASIDQLTLKSARQKLSTRYARSTVTLTMAYAGMIMRAAHASGRIGRDPTRGLKPPKARADDLDGRVGPDQVPTRAEALAILGGAPPRYRAAIALGLNGLRIGEVLGMCADRINVEAATVTIDQQLQRIGGRMVMTTPKAEKTRTIKLPDLVLIEVRRHLRDHQGDGLLFRGVRGTPTMRRDQLYGSAWRPALRAAGLAEDRFVFHSLRHFCASSLLAEGAPITAVAGHLGDTVETVNRVYVHWLRDDRDVPAAVLNRVLTPSTTREQAG